MTGEATGATVACAHVGTTAGILFFRVFSFKCLFDNLVVGAPVEAAFPIGELYVNSNLPTWHNQYRRATYHAIVPNLARATTKHRVFMKGRHMLIFGPSKKAKKEA